ncbi:acyl-ACP--UDP-N-acetylglucosamine O-acyltransferase [Acidocella sp. KAb 2-4]|uniref:acyl-ACP--UDP-N-acetylglucosamine O-acyltransferase n=1 Tax=Acidocella sp. KAb 2-4 TaxID=2885158 RepID=UPI001D0806C1|nr:acyl-ACP--UDP-N-acetylglucosamine O-acyltransferase [Acidocella sp. KAb 2-4]MCB5943181.1 acyl-ACP--UDP-N-acetylglucosamine O-acyltransferase [Acidocella sp. KAb 2-4]
MAQTEIHPTAIVASGAELGQGVKIGPFCTIGPKVVLDDGVTLVSHVAVDGRTQLGAGVKLFPFCTVGLEPQDLKYKGEETETVIGPRTQIREHASIHRGTVTGTGITRIGADCLLMATVHVAHDCVLGDGVIISNNVALGGHVEIGDRAVIGGNAAALQFVRIGAGAMIGGLTGVTRDVIPYARVFGTRAELLGLNLIGLRRRGLDKAQVQAINAAYKFLFTGPGVFAERVAQVRETYAGDAYVQEILAFIATPSKHGILTNVAGAGDDEG